MIEKKRRTQFTIRISFSLKSERFYNLSSSIPLSFSYHSHRSSDLIVVGFIQSSFVFVSYRNSFPLESFYKPIRLSHTHSAILCLINKPLEFAPAQYKVYLLVRISTCSWGSKHVGGGSKWHWCAENGCWCVEMHGWWVEMGVGVSKMCAGG